VAVAVNLALAAPDTGALINTDQALSPTAVASLVVAAFIIDFFAVGPAAFQTRAVFVLVATFSRQGFDDSPLDKWTVDKAAELIQSGLDQTGGAWIAGASANAIVGMLIGALAIFCLGNILPQKWSRRTGRLATLQWKETQLRKINAPVWIVAAVFGMLSDLPDGLIGWLCDAMSNICLFISGPVPEILFGAA
jgi:hypothetical protein